MEQTELIVSGDNRLKELVVQSDLDNTKAAVLLENFEGYFKMAAEWEVKAKAIVVTRVDQKAEMQMARTGRLFLREKRIAIENTRKKLKEQALREGKAIDGIANVLKALIVPIEEYLDSQEKYAQILADKEAARIMAEMEAKAEAERIAREEAERVEQERIRLENERLKAEAEKAEAKRVEREKAIEAERLRVEAEKAATENARIAREQEIEAERARVDAERKADIAKAEKAASDAKLAREQEIEKERARIVAEREAEKKKAAEEFRIAAENAKARIEAAKKEVRLANEKAAAEKVARDKAEAERLAAEVECPFCHKKFVPK